MGYAIGLWMVVNLTSIPIMFIAGIFTTTKG